MSLGSTLCLRIAIAILVQQKIFECSEQCNCRCENNSFICEEIKKLSANDFANEERWKKWETHLPYLKTLHTEFNHENVMNKIKELEDQARIFEEKIKKTSTGSSSNDGEVWTTKINSFEKKIASMESLKEKLDKAESRAARLETALENARNDFEAKMAHLEKKLEDSQIQATALENNVNKAEKKITTNQNKISDIERRMHIVENQTNNLNQSIEAGVKVREQLGVNISNIEERLHFVENQTESLEVIIEVENLERSKLKGDLRQEISRKFSKTEMQIKILKDNIQSQFILLKNETNDLKSDIESEKEARTSFQEEIFSLTSKKFSEIEKQYEELKKKSDTELLNVKNILEDISDRIGFENNGLLPNLSANFCELASKCVELKNGSTVETPIIVDKTTTRPGPFTTSTVTTPINIGTVESRLRYLERDSNNLEKDMADIRYKLALTEEQILSHTSKKFSEIEKQYEELKKKSDTELLNLKNIILEEKSARNRFEGELREEISTKASRNLRRLRRKIQSELILLKNETIVLKSAIESEIEARNSFEEQIFSLTSKKFSEIEKQYEELKKKSDTELLNLNNIILEEKNSRNRFEPFTTSTVTTPINIGTVESRLSYLERDSRNLEREIADIKYNLTLTKERDSNNLEKEMAEIRYNLALTERNVDMLSSTIKSLDIKNTHLETEIYDVRKRLSVLRS